jgi:hypothetical protein
VGEILWRKKKKRRRRRVGECVLVSRII